jgi:hypothetical protein
MAASKRTKRRASTSAGAKSGGAKRKNTGATPKRTRKSTRRKSKRKSTEGRPKAELPEPIATFFF